MKTKLSLVILGSGLAGQQHIKTITTSKHEDYCFSKE